jgi:hypothetical protein
MTGKIREAAEIKVIKMRTNKATRVREYKDI